MKVTFFRKCGPGEKIKRWITAIIISTKYNYIFLKKIKKQTISVENLPLQSKNKAVVIKPFRLRWLISGNNKVLSSRRSD